MFIRCPYCSKYCTYTLNPHNSAHRQAEFCSMYEEMRGERLRNLPRAIQLVNAGLWTQTGCLQHVCSEPLCHAPHSSVWGLEEEVEEEPQRWFFTSPPLLRTWSYRSGRWKATLLWTLQAEDLELMAYQASPTGENNSSSYLSLSSLWKKQKTLCMQK